MDTTVRSFSARDLLTRYNTLDERKWSREGYSSKTDQEKDVLHAALPLLGHSQRICAHRRPAFSTVGMPQLL